MQKSTIAVKPIPSNITPEQLRNIFHAYSIKNVHIQGNTAYVQFNDSGDLETLQVQFQNYQIPQLNNAKIDVAQNFDWNTVKKQESMQNKKSSNSSSDKHEDLMSADIKNLIVIQNCDKNILDELTVQNIRQIFSQYQSVNRIVKRNNQVVIQFLDPNEIQLLQMKFDELNVPKLGKNSRIEKAEDANVTSDQFTSQWSKMNTQQSQITQATQNLGYEDERPFNSSGHSQEVLHQQIIPPFDKKTSMEVNFLNQQQKLGYKQQKKQHEPIHQATTKQELDYTSQLNIEQNEDRFGYISAQKQQEQRKRKQQQQRKHKEEEQRKRKEQEQNQRRQEQEIRRKQQQQEIKRRYEQEKRKKAQEQERIKKQYQQEARRRRQSQLIEKQLKQKLRVQRQKFQKQEQQRKQKQRKQQQARKLVQQKKHVPPTQGEIAANQANVLLKAGEQIQRQLGYAVNQAKQGGINLINQGKQLLKNAAQKIKPDNLGYQQGLIQPPTNDVKNKGQSNRPSDLGYSQWSVKPDINIPRPVSGTHRHISKTLITITLAVWVVFLLFQ